MPPKKKMTLGRNALIAAGGAGAVSYFVDTPFGIVGDVAAGTLIGWSVGHPWIGGIAAFVTPHRRTVEMVTSAGTAARMDAGYTALPGLGEIAAGLGQTVGEIAGKLTGLGYSPPKSRTAAEVTPAKVSKRATSPGRKASAELQWGSWAYYQGPPNVMGWYDTTGSLQTDRIPQGMDQGARTRNAAARLYARQQAARFRAQGNGTLAQKWTKYGQ
jgi:hypothetical protein